ncbi:hypothetical protein ABZ682_06890 [Streptomyces griseoviridis]|uniref:hypothetical protein n=1 Tax=Streptomyces griseoviridis TaxID=45398 RepID=UPI0033C04812
MPRHEFQPGRLLAGLAFTATGVVYAGDAGGLWETPWFAIVPMIVGGLFLAGAAAVVTRAIRHRTPRQNSPDDISPGP